MNNETLEDWQRGQDSKTLPLERVEKMNYWLKENKLFILKNPPTEEVENNIGFDDLKMYE